MATSYYSYPPPLVFPSLDPYGDFLGFQWADDSPNSRPRRFVQPKMDCVLLKDYMHCTLEVPGVKKKDITLTLRDDTLQVLAPILKRLDPPSEHPTHTIAERKLGFWWRAIDVPHGLTEGEVKAKLEDGVLKLVMPRITQEMSQKRVQIEWESEEAATGSE